MFSKGFCLLVLFSEGKAIARFFRMQVFLLDSRQGENLFLILKRKQMKNSFIHLFSVENFLKKYLWVCVLKRPGKVIPRSPVLFFTEDFTYCWYKMTIRKTLTASNRLSSFISYFDSGELRKNRVVTGTSAK